MDTGLCRPETQTRLIVGHQPTCQRAFPSRMSATGRADTTVRNLLVNEPEIFFDGSMMKSVAASENCGTRLLSPKVLTSEISASFGGSLQGKNHGRVQRRDMPCPLMVSKSSQSTVHSHAGWSRRVVTRMRSAVQPDRLFVSTRSASFQGESRRQFNSPDPVARNARKGNVCKRLRYDQSLGGST